MGISPLFGLLLRMNSQTNTHNYFCGTVRQEFEFSVGSQTSNSVNKSQQPRRPINNPQGGGSVTPPPLPTLLEQKRRRVDENPGQTSTIPRYHDQERINMVPAKFEQPNLNRSWSQAVSAQANKKQKIIRSDTGDLSSFHRWIVS